MYGWLKCKCEYLSVAELSVWYTITSVASLIATCLFWGFLVRVADDPHDRGPNSMPGTLLLALLCMWLSFVVWLWVGLVRTAWKWNSERLGTGIFKHLQIGCLVMTPVALLSRGELRDGLAIMPFVLFGFDVAIGIMMFNFLLIVWFARCRIPRHTYWEIASILAMIVIQIWLLSRT